MSLIIINASPKNDGGSCGALIKDFLYYYKDSENAIELHIDGFGDIQQAEKFRELYNSSDPSIIIFTPLYLDGIPSHLLSFLCKLSRIINSSPTGKTYIDGKPHICGVYAVVNCGLYEGEHARVALHILKNWCRRSGMEWHGGIGIGGCGGYSKLHTKPGHGVKREIGKQFIALSESIAGNCVKKDSYISTGYSRSLYKSGAEIGLSMMARANNVKL